MLSVSLGLELTSVLILSSLSPYLEGVNADAGHLSPLPSMLEVPAPRGCSFCQDQPVWAAWRKT